jgi:hypothetical protein
MWTSGMAELSLNQERTPMLHCIFRLGLISAWLLAGKLAAAETLTCRSPLNQQVIQRGPQDTADVEILGQATGPADAIAVAAELAAGSGRGQAVGWTVVAKGEALVAGGFRGKLTLAAGGWYTLRIRAMSGAKVMAEEKIDRVGVGDVFVTAGQSNSANFGSQRMTAEDDRVVYFNGTAFTHASDPIPGGFGGGGSPWPIAGDLIVKATGIPVCFRSTTLDYSPVREWLKGAVQRKQPYYETLLERTRWFGRDGVHAVLWHQGESDSLARTSATDYCQQVGAVVESLNADLGYQLDWFVAGAAFHPGCQKPQWDQVAAGQQLIWQRKIAFRGALTDDLVGPEYRSNDKVHFNAQGLKEHGQRWFKALAAQYGWTAADTKSGNQSPR